MRKCLLLLGVVLSCWGCKEEGIKEVTNGHWPPKQLKTKPMKRLSEHAIQMQAYYAAACFKNGLSDEETNRAGNAIPWEDWEKMDSLKAVSGGIMFYYTNPVVRTETK